MEKNQSLELNKLEVVYQGSIIAVQGATLSVPAKSIVALLGVNGAGKTTTLRAISGFLGIDNARVTDGTIVFCGETLNNKMPHEVVECGIVLVPEREKIFATLTVTENLQGCLKGAASNWSKQVETIFHFFPILYERRNQVAGYLSGGERQMLAISNALLCSPTLLLVDELSLGLAPMTVEHLMERIQALNKELGLSILMVEQTAAALNIAEYGYVMENGHVVFGGTAEQLLKHQNVQEFYLGISEKGTKSYREVKQYRRTRRWMG
ncbi:MAG: ABC transporter ATP-binding protein [Chloroflexi bacterium]|nr:ABC transporter ATP-binding protein [Chloroflexota bacterium]